MIANEEVIQVGTQLTIPFIRCPATTTDEWLTGHNGTNWFVMGFQRKQHPQTNDERFCFSKPAHRVTISRRFSIMVNPVSKSLWESVTRGNLQGIDNDPMVGVSWDDCQSFIGILNQKVAQAGKCFSLPTEAQWEFACLAGRDFYSLSSSQPNQWGIYSMCSGCAEWCLDGKRIYESNTTNPIVDPIGSLESSRKVIRGGDMNDVGFLDRYVVRDFRDKSNRCPHIGFRLVFESTDSVPCQ